METLPTRQPYVSDVSDEEWDFVVPYLTLMTEEAPQRRSSLRELFNGLRSLVAPGTPATGSDVITRRWYQSQQPPRSAAINSITWGTAEPQQLPTGSPAGASQRAATSPAGMAAAPQRSTPRSARMPDEQTRVSGKTSGTSRAPSQSPARVQAMERTYS